MTSSLRSQIGECTGRREGAILTPGEGLGDRPSSRKCCEGVGSVGAGQSKTTELLTGNSGLDENEASSRVVEKEEAKSIEIDPRVGGPVAFVADGDYIISGNGNKVRRWRVKDGKEDGEPMAAERDILSIAVSRDGKWIVSGAAYGHVTVWDAESHKKAIRLIGHELGVFAVDISPDATRIATGSSDSTLCVWSLSTGEQLLGPFKHDDGVAAVKFSPDGRRIATATWSKSVRIYDNHHSRLLVNTPIQVGSSYNQSLVWAGLGRELLALSKDGNIYSIDVASGTILSKWAIHANNNPGCIALASDGAFIAASANSSVSFWDLATHQQIGPLIHHPASVVYMAISANQDLAISGGKKIILRKLPDSLPSSYFDHVCVLSPTPDAKDSKRPCSPRPTYSNSLKPCARMLKNVALKKRSVPIVQNICVQVSLAGRRCRYNPWQSRSSLHLKQTNKKDTPISTTFSRIFLMISPDMLQSPAVSRLRREAMATSTKAL